MSHRNTTHVYTTTHTYTHMSGFHKKTGMQKNYVCTWLCVRSSSYVRAWVCVYGCVSMSVWWCVRLSLYVWEREKAEGFSVTHLIFRKHDVLHSKRLNSLSTTDASVSSPRALIVGIRTIDNCILSSLRAAIVVKLAGSLSRRIQGRLVGGEVTVWYEVSCRLVGHMMQAI